MNISAMNAIRDLIVFKPMQQLMLPAQVVFCLPARLYHYFLLFLPIGRENPRLYLEWADVLVVPEDPVHVQAD